MHFFFWFRDEVIVKLNEDRKFKEAFEAVYPDGYGKDNFVDAIATFERTLITPDSAFDRYLLGDETALSAQERNGHELFQDYGCERCHVGPAMGGRSFEVMGLTADYFADRGDVGEADGGRFNATGNEADRGRFKVPTLRNIALTWPYLHDGSTSDLAEVVQIMGRYQLGSEVPPEEAKLIAEFLGSLTGTYDGVVLQ